jgi:hypothetical protein
MFADVFANSAPLKAQTSTAQPYAGQPLLRDKVVYRAWSQTQECGHFADVHKFSLISFSSLVLVVSGRRVAPYVR